MASNIHEVTKNTARHVIELITQTSENLKMMEVSEHFDPIQELGSGSYGKVLLAKHRGSGQLVAVKLLSKQKVPMDNFLVEYGMSISLSGHPNIIRTHEVAFHTNRDYVFVQEVATAGTLHSLIQPNVGLNEETVKKCVPQIASALQYMHNKGMVHCDIKPDNILLMDFECNIIKVADFGLARLQGTEAPSLSGFIPYTAPEQCNLKPGEQVLLLPSIDIWAFGVMVYIAMTGYFPWIGADGHDPMYRKFAWWQVRKDLTLAPEKWRKFSLEARKMFWDLLALNASERMASNIEDVTKNTAKNLLELISETSENLRMMEVTDFFDPIKELGSGSYGKVLLAKHRGSDKLVAVKLMSKKTTPKDNFLMEYGMSLSLSSHPNIIATHEIVFHTSSDYVFVQEVASAGDLLSIVKERVGLNEDIVKSCVLQIANALDFMHSKGMVHRDIKLDNILLMDMECNNVKLADFGLTMLQGTQAPFMPWFIPYSAPELCTLKQGEKLLLHPSIDIWAFGVMIYAAMTGSFPWREAGSHDLKYQKFAWWQTQKDLTLSPRKWRQFSIEARKMFWGMLALNASERCSALDVLKYVHLPWKAEMPPENLSRNTVVHMT
ncbi:ribosomal protein S6 kinase alpha-6-like [Aquarana catesbeiana]|uniref:ribosomal protein S6 kinase alpha-6-like n=1 Tax=Aquarana catesbeiana TaxID=8400 RepID=UPI003CCA13AB